jgi:hypothetical protein
VSIANSLPYHDPGRRGTTRIDCQQPSMAGENRSDP